MPNDNLINQIRVITRTRFRVIELDGYTLIYIVQWDDGEIGHVTKEFIENCTIQQVCDRPLF